MEMSVREARAQFAHALSVAESGERVTLTKNGKAIAELGPPTSSRKNPFTWDRLQEVRRAMGLDKIAPSPLSEEEWFENFNDPLFTRLMLGEENGDEELDADK